MKRIVFTLLILTAFGLHARVNAQAALPPETVRLQAGDIVLFVSPNYVQRFINGVATGGEITHTGLVVMGKEARSK